jgi:hypothetical protein
LSHRFAGNLPIIEVNRFGADDLTGLMPFARYNHNVSAACFFDRSKDRPSAI